jgi:PAS domain S-box-containing protein
MKENRANYAQIGNGGAAVGERQLRTAEIQQLYSQAAIEHLGSTFLGTIMVAALWGVVSHHGLLMWLGCYVAIQVVRMALVSSFHRVAPSDDYVIPWGRRIDVSTAIAGLAWGMVPIFLFPTNSVNHQSFLTILITGLSCTVAVVYSPRVGSFLPAILAQMLPLAGRHIYEGDKLHISVGGALLGIAAVILLTAERMHRVNLGVLKLRFQNSDLITSLTKEKARAEQLNVDLRAEIEERKSIEHALRENQERYRQLTENSLVGVFVHKGGRLGYVNERLGQMLGYSPYEMLGRQVEEFIHPDDIKMAGRRAITDVGMTDPAPQQEFRILCKNGDIRWAEVRAGTIRYRGRSVVLGNVADITDRKLAEQQTRASLREKELLLREIHHRVKNNLQIVSSLLNLQSRSITDQTYKEMFVESRDRLRSMAYIHEKLYQSKDFGNIDFTGYMKGLVTHLFGSYNVSSNKIKLKTDVQPVSMGIDTATPCGLIVNELVSNSLKYAFPEERNGVIGINLLATKDHELELIVWDDGVGLPKDLDIAAAQTVGLRLVRALAEQIRAEIEISRSNGTEFLFRFKSAKSSDDQQAMDDKSRIRDFGLLDSFTESQEQTLS